MGYKFSGYCYVDIHDGIKEFLDDYSIVGEDYHLVDSMDFSCDVTDNLEFDEDFNQLPDGEYYIYFEGTINFSTYSSMDGTEYDSESYFDYVRYNKIT